MIMKRMILLTGLLVTIAGLASAQTTGSNSSNAPQGSTESANNQKMKKKGTKKNTQNLNQRRNYKWKDGQKATPTGHEATGTGSNYSAIRKDTIATPKDTAKPGTE
jgi:hypothetical protein